MPTLTLPLSVGIIFRRVGKEVETECIYARHDPVIVCDYARSENAAEDFGEPV